MESIRFENNNSQYSNEFIFVAHLAKTIGKQELLNELSSKLNFPNYFGCNWDALYDCLTDFNWIKQKTILIIHQEVPTLNNQELKTYLLILHDSVKQNEKRLEIVFPIEKKTIIDNIIKTIKP